MEEAQRRGIELMLSFAIIIMSLLYGLWSDLLQFDNELWEHAWSWLKWQLADCWVVLGLCTL